MKDELAGVVAEAMERLDVPGAAVGVIHRGNSFACGSGVTTIGYPMPVGPDTLFHIGSITKVFVATAVMRLVESSQLDLDAPIHSYLPSLHLEDEETAARLTLKHLLTHTGGFAPEPPLRSGVDIDSGLERFALSLCRLPQLVPLGAAYSYNNNGFRLAGRIIEVVTGQSFEAAIRALILAPLRMHNSFFAAEAIERPGAWDGENSSRGRSNRIDDPTGGLISCVNDLFRFMEFQLGNGPPRDGGCLLTRESLRCMQSPQAEAAAGEQIGIAWHLRSIGASRVVYHEGVLNGQMSALVMVPANRFAIVVLTNAVSGAALHREVTAWALQHYLGIVEPDGVPFEYPDELLETYAGWYQAPAGEVQIEALDGGLCMDQAPGSADPGSIVRLACCGADRVVTLNGPWKGSKADFVRRPDGSILGFRYRGRIALRKPSEPTI